MRTGRVLLAGMAAVSVLASGCKEKEPGFFAPPLDKLPPGTIQVTILVDGEPFPGSVTVSVAGPTSETRSASGGAIAFTPLSAGRYSVSMEPIPGRECERISITTDLPAGGTRSVLFECVFTIDESLNGLYDFHYELLESSCEEGLEPFTVPATIRVFPGEGAVIELTIQFPDAPVPILGILDPASWTYVGSTGLVDLGNLRVREDMTGTFNASTARFAGKSVVPFSNSVTGQEVCRRLFAVSAVRTGL